MKTIDWDKIKTAFNGDIKLEGKMFIMPMSLAEAFYSKLESEAMKELLSILPKYDDYIHIKTYPYNETMEDIYSKGHEEGWNACLKAIKEELDCWGKENAEN